jgi:cell division GTPase FtsZ
LLAKPESELTQSLAFGNETTAAPQMSFVVADLGEGLSLGAAPVIAEHLRSRSDSLTLGVALLPFSFGGHVLNERARAGLRAMKKTCDSVIVFDSSNLRQEGLQAATFYDLHETFLDMCAGNLHALTWPLIRKQATLRVSLASFRRLFAPEGGRGRECRLVCAQLQSSDAAGNRGKLVLQKALTDEFFPLDDVSQAHGVLIAVDAAKDLTYAEIEQVFTVEDYMSEKALVVQGLTYVDTPGVHVTMAVVGGTVLNAEEQQLERLEQQQEEDRRAREKADVWKRFRDWL